LHLLAFHAYTKEMQAQESKSPVRNLVRQRYTEEFNSGVKGLTVSEIIILVWYSTCIFLVLYSFIYMGSYGPLAPSNGDSGRHSYMLL
jgi:hypothetical protein